MTAPNPLRRLDSDTRKPSRLGVVGGVAAALAGVANLVKTPALTSTIGIDLSLLAVGLLACCVVFSFDVAARGDAIGGWLTGATFVSFSVASFLSTRHSAEAHPKEIQFFLLCALLFAGARILTRNASSRMAFVQTLLVVGGTTALALLAVGTVTGDRTSVGGGDPISLGRAAGLASVIFIAYALYSKGRRRLWCFAGSLISLYGALLTGSRGPLLVTVVAILAVFLRTGRKGRLIKSMTVLGLVFFSLYAAVDSGIASPLARVFGEGVSASDTQRSALLSGTWQLIGDHPGGIGLGNLVLYLSPGAIVPAQGDHQYPHNVLLEAAVEGGWISVVLLTALIMYSFKRVVADATGLIGAAILGCWVIGIGSAMTSSDLVGNRLMWVMLGVSLAMPKLVVKPGRRLSDSTVPPPPALRQATPPTGPSPHL